MNKLTIAIVMFFVSTLGVTAQRRYYVVDDSDRKIVSFASIYITSGKGLYTDENGAFTLNCEKQTDTALISRVGYKTRSFLCGNLPDTIRLTSNNLLAEVVVRANKKYRKTEWLGLGNNKSHGHFSGHNQAALLLENPVGLRRQITTVQFNLSKYRFSSKAEGRIKNIVIIVRLRLYKIGKDGSPSDDLLQENIVQNLKRKQTTLDFDIENYGIMMPSEGIFVAIEFIGLDTEDKRFVSHDSLGYDEMLQFVPQFSNGHSKSQSWSKTKNGGKWIRIKKHGDQSNFNFGAEVVVD